MPELNKSTYSHRFVYRQKRNINQMNWTHLFLFRHGLHHLFFCSNPYSALHLRFVELPPEGGTTGSPVDAPTGPSPENIASGLKGGAFCPCIVSLLSRWDGFNVLIGDFASFVGSRPPKPGGIWPRNWGGTPLGDGGWWDPFWWPEKAFRYWNEA